MKNILITGATRGLGLAYALGISRKGYKIILSDISKSACKVYDKNSSVEKILKKRRDNCVKDEFFEANLISSNEADKLMDRTIFSFININGIIANEVENIYGNDLKKEY